MGRTKPKFPRGKFVIKNKKANPDGLVAIYLQYVVDGSPVSHSTDIFVKMSDFDPGRQEVKPKALSATRINMQLAVIKEKVDKQIMAYEGKLTKSIISKMMDGSMAPKQTAKNTDFIQYTLDYYEREYADGNGRLAYKTFDAARYNLNMFKAFILEKTGEPFVYIADVNRQLIDEYKDHCQDRGNTKETINQKLKPIVAGATYCLDNELMSQKIATTIKHSYYQLREVHYKSEVEEAEVRYLTEPQMQEFVDLYWKVKYPRTRDFMDMFLFSFYCCGLRVSDVITLEWRHLDMKNRRLKKNIVKTKIEFENYIPSGAYEILQRWEGRYDRFVFGLLPSDFNVDDPEELSRAINNQNRTIRQSLKGLGEKMKLPFHLSMHVARHTFAVYALQRNISTHLISKLLCHQNSLVTEKVYAEFLPETITKEIMDKLEFSFVPQQD